MTYPASASDRSMTSGVVLTRSRWLTDVSAGLVALGAQGHAAPVTFNSFLTKMRTGEPAEMATLLDRVNTGPVVRAGLERDRAGVRRAVTGPHERDRLSAAPLMAGGPMRSPLHPSKPSYGDGRIQMQGLRSRWFG